MRSERSRPRIAHPRAAGAAPPAAAAAHSPPAARLLPWARQPPRTPPASRALRGCRPAPVASSGCPGALPRPPRRHTAGEPEPRSRPRRYPPPPAGRAGAGRVRGRRRFGTICSKRPRSSRPRGGLKRLPVPLPGSTGSRGGGGEENALLLGVSPRAARRFLVAFRSAGGSVSPASVARSP